MSPTRCSCLYLFGYLSLILSEAAEWSRGSQTSHKDNGEASSLNGNGRTLGDIIFNVYAKNASMPSLLERMLADDVSKQTNHVRHEVRGFRPAATQTVQRQNNGSVRKGVPRQQGQSFRAPPDATDVAHPQNGIGYAERELELFHQMFDKYLNFKAHRTGEETQDSRKELESTCEKILRRKEKRAGSGMGGNSSQVGVTTAEADHSHRLSMGDHYQMPSTTRASQNTANQETNLFSSFENFVKTMFSPFTGLSHEAPSQRESEGRDDATIRQEFFNTDLTQRSPEESPVTDASRTPPAGLGTRPRTEEMTTSQPNVFTSTTMKSKVGKPTSTPDYLKNSSPKSVTETQPEVSTSATETHPGDSTTSTTPTAVFQTDSLFTTTTEKSDFSTPSKGYDLSTSSTELQNHDFPTLSKAAQKYSSRDPSRGQQHDSPYPSERPQQQGFPTFSNGAPLSASLTPSERPQLSGSSTVPVSPQELRSPTPSKGSYQPGFAIHSKGLQKHGSPKPSKGPQQHRSSALSKGLTNHGLPIPIRGPQQHGFPGPSHPAVSADPFTQSSAGSETSYVPKEHLFSKGNGRKSAKNGLTIPKGRGVLRRSLLLQEDEPKSVDHEYVVIKFVSTTSPPEGNRHELGKIEETADSSNQADIRLLEKFLKNLNEQFSRRAPTKNDVRNLEAAIERLNAALLEFAEAEARQEPVRGSTLTSRGRRVGQKEAAESQRSQLKPEPAGRADKAPKEIILFPEAIFTGGRAEREGGARREDVTSGRRAPAKEAQEAKRTAGLPPLKRRGEVGGMFPRGDPSAGDSSVLGNAVRCADAVQPSERSATRFRRVPLSRYNPPANARSRRTPKRSLKVSSPDILVGVKHSPFPISSTKRHREPLHHLPLSARGQQAPGSSVLRPPERAMAPKVSRGSPKRASLSLSQVRSGQGASAQSTPRTSSTPEPHILKGSSLSFRGNGKSTANVPAPAQRLPVNRTPTRSVKPSTFKSAPATRSPPYTLRSDAHVIRHGSMYSRRNGPKPPIRKRSLLTRPPSLRKHNPRSDVPFSLAHRPRPANSFPSRRDGTPSNISDEDQRAPLKRPRVNSRSTKPRGGVYPPGTGNRKSFLNSGIQLRDKPQAVSADSSDQRVRASQPSRNGRRVNPSYGLVPPPENVRSSNPFHRLRSPSPENVQFSNPSLRLDPPSPENVWLANPYHSLNPLFPKNVAASHPFHRLNSPSPGNVRSSSHSRSFRPSSPGNRRASNPSHSFNPPSPENVQYSNLSLSFNPPFPDIQSSSPSSRLLSAGSSKSLNPSQGLRSSSSGNRRPLNRSFNRNPSSSGILRPSESSWRLNPYSTGNMENSNRRYTNHSQNLNTGCRRSSSSSYNLNPTLIEKGRSSLVKGSPNSGEMSPKLPHRLSPRPPVKGRLSELFYKFASPASAKKRSHKPNPSSAMDELLKAIPNNPPHVSSVGRLSQKAPGKRPSNSHGSISDASINRFPNPSRGPGLAAPSTRTSMRLIDDPSQISNTRCIHLVHYLNTPVDRSAALHHPTPAARWDRTPFEESAITFPTERPLPNPVTAAPSRRALKPFFQSMPILMENLAPRSLNALSLDNPIRRQVPRLHQTRGHRRPIGLSSNPYCGPNPVAPVGASPPPEQSLLRVTSPPTFTDEALLLIPDEAQEPRVHHREVVTAVAPLHPEDAAEETWVGARAPRLHRVHDPYSTASQPSHLGASTLVRNWQPLSAHTATTLKHRSTAKASEGSSKHKHHHATSGEASAESAKRKIGHNKTIRLPKKKPYETYRVKSSPDPVRKKLSKASPNPAPRPLDPPPNKSPSGPLNKKSWRPPLVSNPNVALDEGSSLDPVNGRLEAHSQASATDMSANRVAFLAVPNVGQIAENRHGRRAYAPAVGLPSSPTMDLDHREPNHLGSRKALPPHGYAASSPRARSSGLFSSGRPPGDTNPNRFLSRGAYELLHRSIRSVDAGMRALAFPSRRRTKMAPASQRAPPTLASHRVSSPASGPIPGHGSFPESAHSPANPAAQGKLAASRLNTVPRPNVERTM